MSITDSLKRRAHVVHYKKDIIPTKSKIEGDVKNRISSCNIKTKSII